MNAALEAHIDMRLHIKYYINSTSSIAPNPNSPQPEPLGWSTTTILLYSPTIYVRMLFQPSSVAFKRPTGPPPPFFFTVVLTKVSHAFDGLFL